MKRLVITTGTPEDFFARSCEIARLADQGKLIPERCIHSFGDPADMMKLLMTARIELFCETKHRPITKG